MIECKKCKLPLFRMDVVDYEEVWDKGFCILPKEVIKTVRCPRCFTLTKTNKIEG